METIEIPLSNQQTPVPDIRTRTWFIVRDRLDEDVLRNGLDELIRKHWRKLGARLHKRSSDGFYEYHLPKQFADDYELFKWSSEEKSHSIDEEDTIVVKAPSADTKGISFLPGAECFDAVFRPSSWPDNLHDGNPAKDPMLYVHLICYSDATVISISYPHILGDQFGLANIVQAWVGIIRGQAPPTMVAYDEDVLPGNPYATYPKHRVVRKGRMHVRKPLEYAFVLLPFLPELIFQRKETEQTLYFPEPMIASLREKFSKELAEQYGSDPGISNGDVLTAILTKFARMTRKKPETLGLSQTINLRGRVPALSGTERTGYIHNSLHYSTARFQLNPSTPLKEIAYRNRLAVNLGIKPEECEIGIVVAREMTRKGQGLHICEPFDRSFAVTSWGGAWKEIDFSCAVRASEKGELNGASKEAENVSMMVFGQGKVHKTPSRFHSTIMGRMGGGFWCDFSATPKTMEAVHAYLAKDPLLERL